MAEDRTVVDTVSRGFHIYKDVWNPVIGETLTCKPEFGNIHDPYAVAVCKGKRFWKYLRVFVTPNSAPLLAIRTFSSVEKLAYGPRVVLVLLPCTVLSWRAKPDTSRLAAKIASDGMRSERGPFGFGSPLVLGAFSKYLYSTIFRPGMNYRSMRNTWQRHYISMKIILRMQANSRNSRNIRPAKFKRFMIWMLGILKDYCI